MRAFVRLWDEITAGALRRAGREDAPVPLRRAGQLARPDRGPAGEQRAADRARDARRDAVQERPRPRRPAAGVERGARACRARGTSSGRCGCSRCSRSSPTCWSTSDIFEGSHVIEAKVAELVRGGARGDRPGAGDGRGDRGRRVRLHEAGAGQLALRAPRADRERRGEGRRRQQSSRPPSRRRSRPTSTPRSRPPTPRPSAPRSPVWRPGSRQRDQAEVDEALRRLAEDAKTDANLMAATLVAARAGATTGEWAGALREVFGEFRAPTGCLRCGGCRRRGGEAGVELADGPRAGATDRRGARRAAAAAGRQARPRRALQRRRAGRGPGARRRLRGRLPGHPADARADRRRGRRRGRARVGLSILSGSHMELVPDVLRAMKEAGIDDVPVIVGGIIPTRDAGRCGRWASRPCSRPRTSA